MSYASLHTRQTGIVTLTCISSMEVDLLPTFQLSFLKCCKLSLINNRERLLLKYPSIEFLKQPRLALLKYPQLPLVPSCPKLPPLKYSHFFSSLKYLQQSILKYHKNKLALLKCFRFLLSYLARTFAIPNPG